MSKGLLELTPEDWDVMLPGEIVQIGRVSHVVTPLGLRELKDLIIRLRPLIPKFEALGITFDNFDDPENLPQVVDILISDVPDAIAVAVGVRPDDFVKLPLAVAVDLVNAFLKVNVESQQGLVKNLTALTDTLRSLVGSGD